MVKISVLTITHREVFIEEQINALKSSGFKDFEWVLVDDLYEQRKDKVKELVNGVFPLIHISPKKVSQYFSFGLCMNDGIVHASGDTIFFKNDYVLPTPDCLGRHYEVHQKYPNLMLSGRTILLDEGDKGHDYRIYLFKQGLYRWQNVGKDLYEAFRDGIQCWWSGRNDSVRMESLLKCNGFDETMDGRWGGHDADLAQRLMTSGCRYFIDLKSSCIELPHKSGEKKAIRSEVLQQRFQRMIDRDVEDGVYKSRTERNLKEERCKLLGLP